MPPTHTQILSSNMLMIDLVGLIWEMRTLYFNLEVSDQPLVLWEMSEFLVLLRLPTSRVLVHRCVLSCLACEVLGIFHRASSIPCEHSAY